VGGHEPQMQLAQDTVIAGRFRLNHLIARGGMGSVWHATHLGLDIPCAVKFIETALSPWSFSRGKICVTAWRW
jgi:hypothetical protein